MDTPKKVTRASDSAGNTPMVRIRADGTCSMGPAKGREATKIYENSYRTNNSNNNSNNSNANNSCNFNSNNAVRLEERRPDADAFGHAIPVVREVKGRYGGYRGSCTGTNSRYDTSIKNNNIITIINNSIDFDDLDDRKSDDPDKNASSCSSDGFSNNSNVLETEQKANVVENLSKAKSPIPTAETNENATSEVDSEESEKCENKAIEVGCEEPKSTTNNSTTTTTANEELSFCDPRQNQVFLLLTGIQQMRREDKYTDITVKVQGQDFRCHKFVLAQSSPFFKSMIDGTSPGEKAEPDVSSQGVPDTKMSSNSDATDSSTKGNGVNFNRNNNNNNSVDKGDLPRGDGGGGRGVKGGGGERRPSGRGRGIRRERPAEKEEKKKVNIENSGDTLVLNGVKPQIFDKILDFIYCVFDDAITEENALELLLAADTLQLPYLSQTCASFITETLSSSNVYDVISLYDSGCARLFDQRVMRKAHQVLRENFLTLAAADEFLTLGRHHVISLMADSMLSVNAEMLVLQALLRWVKVRPEERTADMTLMLQHIRFPLMSPMELDKAREISLLKENSLAMALVDESRLYSNLDYCERMSWPRQNCISRRSFPCRDFILWTADRDKGLHFYSIIDGAHHKVTTFNATPKPVTGPFAFDSTSSVCCYGDRIFFTGGEFTTDMTWSVDTTTGEIKVHAKMPRGRKFHSMIASRGCVYCLGGQDKRGYTVLDSVDAYIISKDVWVKVGQLSVPAYNMAAVVSGGAIYLLGGVDHSGQPLRLIQCFVALRSGLYSAFKVDVTGMPPSLLSARAVTSGLDGFIYIVCGHGEVYMFEPEKRHLSHVTTIKNLSENPRVRFGLAHVGGCLVVIGGHQLGHLMQDPIRSVCLDIATKTEVRDYSPLLPGDIVNTCLSAKLSSNTSSLFSEN